MSSALRMRHHRERIRSGRVVLQVDVDIVDCEQLLRDAGLLGPDCDDRSKVEAALSQLIALLVADSDASRRSTL